MKFLKQILLMAVVVFALSMTAMAQKDGDKDRPKKPDPPKIEPPDKDKPKDRPKDDKDRPKKPQFVVYISGNRSEINSV